MSVEFRPLGTQALCALERALHPTETSWSAFNYYIPHTKTARYRLCSDYIHKYWLRSSVNMAPRSYISAMDLPTVLNIIYRMVSAQQTNLSVWDGRIFPKRRHFHSEVYYTYVYRTSLQYVISYDCTITIPYIYNIYTNTMETMSK